MQAYSYSRIFASRRSFTSITTGFSSWHVVRKPSSYSHLLFCLVCLFSFSFVFWPVCPSDHLLYLPWGCCSVGSHAMSFCSYLLFNLVSLFSLCLLLLINSARKVNTYYAATADEYILASEATELLFTTKEKRIRRWRLTMMNSADSRRRLMLRPFLSLQYSRLQLLCNCNLQYCLCAQYVSRLAPCFMPFSA